ncbi:MAG: hypothetical protein SOY61_08245 [Campylobacter sp.]|nr:hypothetical protein [Campylobacter sp.]
MLNDKPIFVAKSRAFGGLILAAISLMMALVIYFVSQGQEADKSKQVVLWVGVGFFAIYGAGMLYKTLIFKKIMLFDDRIEVHCLNKVIVRAYSQIKSFELVEYGSWPTTKELILECEPDFIQAYYLRNIFLHINELYKIKEILIKKGVKDKG